MEVFNSTLKMELPCIGNNNSQTWFEGKFLHVLNKQAPLKTKLLRYSNNAFMSKEFRKSIMIRSKLKNTFNNINCVSLRVQSECGKIRTRKTRNTDTFYAMNESYENWCKYKCQRNIGVNLLKKTKENSLQIQIKRNSFITGHFGRKLSPI